MLRLFVSLYLAIVVGLFSINWGTELIWQYFSPDPEINSEFSHIKKLVQSLPILIAQNKQQKKLFEQSSGLPLTIRAIDDIAWLPAQQALLAKGQVVISYPTGNSAMFYLQDAQQQKLYQLGPINTPTNNSGLKYFILALSYLLLALIIALWTKPIWQDLRQLQKMAGDIQQGNLELDYQVNKHSPTAVVVATFNELTQRITSLLLEQKHLVNAVSHELRTPLARLRFSLAMLDIDQTTRSEISSDIKEMETLVDEMLEYSRIENLDREKDKSFVNIEQLLLNLIEKQQRASEKKILLVVKQAIAYWGHGVLLERACQNLLVNAIRYAKNNIVIAVRIENNHLLIAVSDDGDGVNIENLDDIFQPFFTLDKSRSKGQNGIGLGLAIVKRIADLHQGRCLYQAAELGGAQFTLVLPLGLKDTDFHLS